jgi:biotin carboxyl carrier protein
LDEHCSVLRCVRRSGVAVEEIHAEMVSSVWKVLVAPGHRVAAGDALVILESMKMEIPVLTERAGTVKELHVVEGEVLQEGDLIATVDD